ncbi:MAG: hypothetical protein ACI81V_000933 [Lentimonas sp.]|jgi:hypothetical protein
MSQAPDHSAPRPELWHWPNILSIDAAGIALAWLWAFAHAFDSTLHAGAYLVLGASAWLVYAADRLLDVAPRKSEQLLSHRHRFAKAHARPLWLLWAIVLLADIALAFTTLSTYQLRHGFVLLGAAILYTLLNQKLSKRCFPKEICVALIYAGGVIVFLNGHLPWLPALSFALLCFLNCALIGIKEQSIDRALEVDSLARHLTGNKLWLGFGLTALSLPLVPAPLNWGIGSSLALLALVQLRHARLQIETFRVLADAALFAGPLLLVLAYSRH